jgi:hypothetical protein
VDGLTEASIVASTPKKGEQLITVAMIASYENRIPQAKKKKTTTTTTTTTTDNHQPNFVSIVKKKKSNNIYHYFLCLKQSYTVGELAAASGREKTTMCLQHRAGVRAAAKSA